MTGSLFRVFFRIEFWTSTTTILTMDDEPSFPLKPPLHNSSSSRDKEPTDDLEKLRKWQEDRLARRLRGEYESAVLHLSDVVCTTLEEKQ